MTNPIGAPAMVSIDRREALRSAAARSGQGGAGVYDVETIERLLHRRHQEVADAATVSSVVPLLAERFTRERLTASAPAGRLGPGGVPPGGSSAGSALSGRAPGGAGTSPGGSVE